MLEPQYLHTRIALVKHNYRTRIVLCLVDVQDHQVRGARRGRGDGSRPLSCPERSTRSNS
jgi:hypothetical protein